MPHQMFVVNCCPGHLSPGRTHEGLGHPLSSIEGSPSVLQPCTTLLAQMPYVALKEGNTTSKVNSELSEPDVPLVPLIITPLTSLSFAGFCQVKIWLSLSNQQLLFLSFFPSPKEPVSSTLYGPRFLTGEVGGSVTHQCFYSIIPVNKYDRKYWCRIARSGVCSTIISTTGYTSEKYMGRVSLEDIPQNGTFMVTMTDLRSSDTGSYRCGIGITNRDLYVSLNLTVLAGRMLAGARGSSAPPAWLGAGCWSTHTLQLSTFSDPVLLTRYDRV